MRNRREQFLKLICLLFAAVLVLHVTRLVVAKPFIRLTVPPLPSLPADAQARKDGGTNSPAAKKDQKAGTNSATADAKSKTGTNAGAVKESAKKIQTNGLNASLSTNAASTNRTAVETNDLVASASQTNRAILNPTNAESAEKAGTNEAPVASRKKSKSGKTNVVAESAGPGQNTNTNGTNVFAGASTNTAGSTNAAHGGTNDVAAKNARKKGPSGVPGGPGGPGKTAELPPEIKDRVERIVQAEILGQVMRPMPMALLGIAGETAMLRSPEGQTGLVKEGDSLGTLKLLKIGTNRVLVEVKGEKADAEPEKKELMMFAGLGSESLLPKDSKEPKDSKASKDSKESREPKKPDETTKKKP